MFTSASIKGLMHTISTVLEIPVIIILMLFIAIVIIELGSLAVEAIFERRKAKVNVANILDEIQDKNPTEMTQIVKDSKFLKKPKKALLKLLEHDNLSTESIESLARKLMSEEEARYHKIVSVTDMIVRLGPMFGLMATLIPLGPGLLALGQGDTKTLSDSLLTAFDATVAGLAAAGVAFVISRFRKAWYENDLSATEVVMEGILEELKYDEKQITQ